MEQGARGRAHSAEGIGQSAEVGGRRSEDGKGSADFADYRRLEGEESGRQCTWVRDGFDRENHLCEECLLKLELPLLKENGQNLGTLWLVKDLKRDTVTHYTLRRTLISTLEKLEDTANP